MEVIRLEAPDTPGIELDLQQYVVPEGSVSNAQLGDVAHSHFCFGVPDVWASYKELKSKGVEFSFNSKTSPPGVKTKISS